MHFIVKFNWKNLVVSTFFYYFAHNNINYDNNFNTIIIFYLLIKTKET